MAHGLGIGIPFTSLAIGEFSPNTAPVELVIPEPGKLDRTKLPMPIIGTNIVCRIFGRNNSNNPLAIQVKWDGRVMEQAIFYGTSYAGEPFAGIWTLFNQNTPVSGGGYLEIFCGRDRAGACAIRAGSVGGSAELVGTDFENGLTINYPMTPNNRLLVVGGCLNAGGAPISSDRLVTQSAPEITHHVDNPPGAAAYFGTTVNKSADDNYSLIPAVDYPGIMVVAEWAITGATGHAAEEG